MSYYPTIDTSTLSESVTAYSEVIYPMDPPFGVSAWNRMHDNYGEPWASEFKISLTLEAVQAYIDSNKTYIGALHRVVNDGSNNGLYHIVYDQNHNLVYRKIASTPVTLMNDASTSFAEAQSSFYSEFDGYAAGYNGMQQHDQLFNDGSLPLEAFLTFDTLQHAIYMVSPILNERDEILYDAYPGKYISVVMDPVSSNNGLYFVAGSGYDQMRLYRLKYADEI